VPGLQSWICTGSLYCNENEKSVLNHFMPSEFFASRLPALRG
jgi:hypothetical protein